MSTIEGVGLYIPPTFSLLAEESEVDSLDIQDMVDSASTLSDTPGWTATVDQLLAAAQDILGTTAYNVLQEAVDPMTDAVNDGIVPPNLAANFYSWLRGYAGVEQIPTTGTYAFVQGYIVQWAQQYGWATMGPEPLPTPVVQQLIESATAVAPLPGAVTVPQTLPAPSVGQQAVVARASTITPSTVTGGTDNGTSADQVSAALAVTFVDAMRVLAHVIDDMLPNMAPGQVPEALSEINTAVNALEHQMSLVRAGVYPTGFVGVQEALNGGLQALNGLAQEVNILAEQMATKADSGILDDVTAQGAELATVAGTVGGLVSTTIPELASGLGTLTGQVGDLDNTVTNEVQPQLAQNTQDVEGLTNELSGTDKECLDQLCDAINNVTNPVEEGGATPSLLKQLGGLLGKALELGFIAAIVDTLVTIADAQVAVTAVVQDTETMAQWATSAAGVIVTDLSWQGAL